LRYRPSRTQETLRVFARARAQPRRAKERERSPEQETKLVVERAERERSGSTPRMPSAPTLSYVAVLSDQELVEALRGLSVESVGWTRKTTGLSAKTDRLRTINLSDGHKHVVIDAWSITDWALLQTIWTRSVQCGCTRTCSTWRSCSRSG
jgi:hypothetical protein